MYHCQKFDTSTKGAGVKATKSLKTGTVVLEEDSYACIVKKGNHDYYCSNCLVDRSCANLRACSLCKHVYYCSRECQKKDWKFHKYECKIWKSLKTAPGLVDLHFHLLRVVINMIGSEKNEKPTRTIEDLFSNYTTKTVEDEKKCYLQVFFKLQHLCKISNLEVPDKFTSAEFIIHLISKIKCNSFTITNEDFSEQIGFGLYLNGSLFNHDCDPNCVQIFDGPKLKVVALRDISPDEELTISYCNLPDCKYERQDYLDTYGFLCTCQVCRASKHEKEMLSLKENSVMTKSEYKEMQQFIAKISDQNEPLKVAAMLKMYLGEGNILRIKKMESLADELVELRNFDLAYQYYAEVLPYLHKYGALSYLIGLTHANMGKIMSYTLNNRKACYHLKEALKRLSPILGNKKKSPIMLECRQTLGQILMEMKNS